jgi:hypothetical protein
VSRVDLSGIAFVLTAMLFVGPGAAGADEVTPHTAAAVAKPRMSGIDGEVLRLARGLNLDTAQQSAVRSALVARALGTQRVWNNQAMSAADRIAATHTIDRLTIDRIRAVLSDQQRQLYYPPLPKGGTSAASDGRSVEDWMNMAAGQPAAAVPEKQHATESQGRTGGRPSQPQPP